MYMGYSMQINMVYSVPDEKWHTSILVQLWLMNSYCTAFGFLTVYVNSQVYDLARGLNNNGL